jgi:REP element-mobilizing transposase RayT
MARPWRIQFPGAVYHVTARGNGRRAIFLEDADRSGFLDLLGAGSERFHFQIFAFCLMTNHYHLFLRTPESNLASALQWVNSVYAVRFHRRHDQSGHLFQGRYHAVLVADEAHWLHLSMYLHLNPVRARLVQDPAQFPWSSFRDYTREQCRFEWLLRDEILSYYGNTPSSQFRHYRQDCLALAETLPDLGKQLRGGLVLGSREAVKKLAEKFGPGDEAKEAQVVRLVPRPQIQVESELMRVARLFGVEAKDLQRRRRSFAGRLALYYHLVENCGLSVTETASALGMKPPSVSWGLQKFKLLLSKDKALQRKLNQLI